MRKITVKHTIYSLTVKASGYSMYPFICPGMTLVLRKIPFDKVAVTDVISVPFVRLINIQKQQFAFITHRAFRKDRKTIYTKGDNNEHIDQDTIDQSMNIYRLQKIIYQSKEFDCRGFRGKSADIIMYAYSILKLHHVPDRYLRGRKWLLRRLTGFTV